MLGVDETWACTCVGDNGNGALDNGEIWAYTCSAGNVSAAFTYFQREHWRAELALR